MSSRALLNVQVLRAVAAGIVAFYHLQPMLATAYGVPVNSHFGAFGVDIFFVISGFVMYLSNQKMDRPIAPFLVGRFFRIVPLYWMATLAMVAFFYAGFHPNGLMHVEPYMLLQSMVFVTTHFPDGRYDLILSLGWTLIYELFFYFVFALSFPTRTPGRSLALVSVVFVVLALIGAAFPEIPVRIAYFLRPITLEFLLGGALALVVIRWEARNAELPSWASAASAAAIFAGCALVLAMESAGGDVPRGEVRAFVWGPPALLIVGGFVVLERCGIVIRNRPTLLLGAASYMLYLFHPLVMQGTVKIVAKTLPVTGILGVIVGAILALGAAAIAAILVHLLIERRILGIGKRTVRWMADYRNYRQPRPERTGTPATAADA